jgi:hypothetical protein
VGKLGVSGAFGVAYVFGMELYPTPVRNLGTAMTTQVPLIFWYIAILVQTYKQ